MERGVCVCMCVHVGKGGGGLEIFQKICDKILIARPRNLSHVL